MVISEAEAYRLGNGVICCVYHSVIDNHIPFVGHAHREWAIISWVMIPGGGGDSIYLVVLMALNSGSPPLPAELFVESSFGPRRLSLRPASEPLPAHLGAALAEVILSISGRQKVSELARLINALASVPRADTAASPLPATLTSAIVGSRLELDGCHTGFYVVGRTNNMAAIARVLAISYKGDASMRTSLDLDARLFGEDFWLLGDGHFLALSTAETR